ncbi:SprT family zinc-dependent metalloprotease [Enterovirga sp.]|uniref:M48 family metallopeptidase n=1 Tax=Enterovirga sp. TaxID=2026350 RepID=UPI002615FA7B|nr:SprT family zinc-dependent metalloprotease [Enterovirga sp.]MDB5592822.1 metal-dependent hydrolase [Enterovirga sp.]
MRWLRRIVQPEPDRLSVASAGPPIVVHLRRRDTAKRMTLRVSSATGEVALTLPPRADLRTAQRFLDGQANWIATRLARRPERLPFVPGAVIPLRDEPHLIGHRPGERGRTRVVRMEGGPPEIVVGGDVEAVPGRVRRFLMAEAQQDLSAAVRRHAGRLGVPFGRLTLRDTRSRWGSCSSTGALSFSWRLILAPAEVLDYLAAHEVAHLKEMNHSPAFWRVLRDLCPATDSAEAWLKRNGTGLHRFG